MSEVSDTRGQTKMCAVLFVDIVGYSKKANTEQMKLKECFVSLWGQAISEVPQSDIMVVDAGDGAALTALVEPEDTLRIAQKLRKLLIAKEAESPGLIQMRIGINFGPVQLSKDVHGKDCIVGDAINIAQRVMSFADPGQIMISRSYFDVILPLSEKYQEIFFYVGKRPDKHNRFHDVYSLRELGSTNEEVAVKTSSLDVITQKKTQDSSLTESSLNFIKSVIMFLLRVVRFVLLAVFIYELFALFPVIRKPELIKVELNRQIQVVKEVLGGISTVGDSIAPGSLKPASASSATEHNEAANAHPAHKHKVKTHDLPASDPAATSAQ